MVTPVPRGNTTAAYFLEGVDRVMKVLDCFTFETPELRLTDLSERLGMSKAQVLRIVSTLESGGYVERDAETKRYRLGVRLFHLGMIVRHGMDLRELSLPHLRHLADVTEETAALFVPDPLGPTCTAVVQSRRAMRVFAQLGARMPWNAGTSPKVILAYLPEAEREQILARADFKRYTNFTIIDPERLRDILSEIRRVGYHVGDRDLDEDARGISAPIFDDDGQIVGAVGLAAPAVRLTEAELERSIGLVREVTAAISRELGYCPAPEASRTTPEASRTSGIPGRSHHRAAVSPVRTSVSATQVSPCRERGS
ncbi:MAG: IclR family transcriptional regulator [Chloroflexota bacterium]|nr:IclR family transcriptional regulator [Chloroflexota bacterium]